MTREIIITEADKQKLQKIVDDIIQYSTDGREHVKLLEAELTKAKTVTAEQIPADVVTMNSKVLLSIGDLEEKIAYTLVYPEDANFSQNRISVMAPIGTAILGYKEGNTIEWHVPNGVERIKILKILYQPESSGDFDL
jgi:regulator of nucleoside diphosphate kinase